jgi:enterochelin esterase-like enzyme
VFHKFFSALIVLTLLNFASTASSRADASCNEPRGLVEQRTYHSALLKTEMSYAVYTPPCYSQTTQRYPVIYLMHGSNATGTDYWLKLGLAEALDQGIGAGTLPPVIVVLPYGGWIANQNQFDQVSWNNIFLTELMPAAETAYRIDARRETRAIGGISRGGFWAFSIAFQHPDLFSILGGHSPYFDLDHLRTANPLFLVETAPGIETLRIWMDHGKDDYAGPNIDLLHRRLDARNIPHAYLVYPEGGHNTEYWASHVPDYLLFYAADWLRITPPPTPTLPPARYRQSETPTVFLPAVAYRSLQASISTERLRAVREGGADKSLVLDQPTAEALAALGVKLHPQTRIVASDDLLPRSRQIG